MIIFLMKLLKKGQYHLSKRQERNNHLFFRFIDFVNTKQFVVSTIGLSYQLVINQQEDHLNYMILRITNKICMGRKPPFPNS